jgi:aspartyl-tRNA(Asn)/glutamyl-tRNA(Gln) amidotransferase subunit A
MALDHAVDKVQSGDGTAVAIAERSLARARGVGTSLGAFVHVRDDASVLAQAADIDARRARGERIGRLAGVPVAIKDGICTQGVPSTAASRLLAGYLPPYDATVIARLKAEDALIIGKTNQDEFAMGSTTEHSAYGACKNPWDQGRVAGGSSGGSAAAVAAHVVPVSLGSDTGGSVRQPAALTGIVGIKPTYGRVSRFGLIAFASSLDQVGPMGRTVRDAARVLSVIAGHDPKDATSADVPVPDYEALLGQDVRGLRIGVPAELFESGQGAGADLGFALVEKAIDALAARGCVVTPVRLPHVKHAVATYYVIAAAEASSNLSRFDGVRYGVRSTAPRSTEQLYEESRQGFGPEVRRRILLGTFVLSAGYHEAYYQRAQRVRRRISMELEQVLADVDVLACPTWPGVAPALGELTKDPLRTYLADLCTLPASLAGLPAVSVPCGLLQGLPVGLQLIGRPFDEARLLQLAGTVEDALPAVPCPLGLERP